MKLKFTSIKALSIIILANLLLSSSIFAQSPDKMSYQAVIRNSSDQLVPNQSVGMQISILQNSTPVFVETHNATTNVNGLVSVEIGNGSVVSGTFASINWASGTYFIKTEIDPTGGASYTITGTTQLLSVPYALHAAEAATVPDNAITLPKISAAGASSGEVLSFNGSSVVWDPAGDITGVEAGDGLVGGATAGNAVLNVGAGTGISVAANAISLNETYTNGLYVNEGQTNSISTGMIQNTSVTNGKMSGSGASSGQVLSYNGANVVWTTPSSGSSVWSLNGSSAYYNAGLVGIGTTSPSWGLDLVSATNSHDLYIENTYPFVTLNTSSGTGNAGIAFQDQGAYDGWIYHNPNTDAIYISGENTNVAQPNLVVASNGYVGVGTDAPTQQLHVIGVISVDGLGIESVGLNNMALDGDIIPRMGDAGGYDLGNNVADEHWDDVVANTFSTFSDARVKNSVETLNAGLNEIMELRPVKFKYNHNIDNDDKLRFGLIAQEVEAVLPSIVSNEDVDTDPKTGEIVRTTGEFKTLNYMDLIPVLVKAIQEQQERIEELESTIENLRVPVLYQEGFEDSNPR